MPFQRFLAERFSQGANLILAPDLLPSQSWRKLVNARLTRILGVCSNRPGMTAVSSALGGIIWALWSRFGVSSDSRYAHVGTRLYRLTAAWGGGTLLSSALDTTPASAVNMVDGGGGIQTYITQPTMGQYKDSGTAFTPWGIAAPSAPPSAVVLATDLSTTIEAMDTAANWTVSSGLSAGPTDETNIKQEGTGSVTITVAASTLGTMARSLGATTNLDTLTGGDATVKADDYIHLWVRADRPERVSYLQLDFDLDTTTVANAFRTNYYSMRLPGLTYLNQGRDQWSKIQVPKSQFQRFGSSTSLDWADVECVRLSVLTTSEGSCQLYVDDLKLRGGTDIVGSVRYAVCYRNTTTKARGNPALDANEQVRYTTPLEVDRQRTSITITNVIMGGAAHPGDTQITHMRLYRSIDEGDALQIDEIVDTTASPYVDGVSVISTLLTRTLEADNGLPPNGELVFGPGAQNRLFMLYGQNDLAYSKAWEADDNRAENWPPTFRLKIGDGSERALAGLVTDTTILVWTDEQTYTVQGVGADTFLALPLPNSRGVVGRFAIAEGDGAVFFVAHDGLYRQQGLRQERLTDTIAPFFKGERVAGQLGWNTDPTVLSLVRLVWHADPIAPFLLMLYPEGAWVPDGISASTHLNRELYCGRNPATGRYEHISFDTRGEGMRLQSLHHDPEANLLYGGGGNGIVSRLEDATVEMDNAESFVWEARTASEVHQAPQAALFVPQAFVELDSHAGQVAVTAYYDRQTQPEALGTITTLDAVTSTAFPLAEPEAYRHDMALGFMATITARLDLYRYGWTYELQPELMTFWDSGLLELGYQAQVTGLWYTVATTAPVQVALRLDQQLPTAYTLLSTDGVRQSDRVFCVPGCRGRALRVTLSSTTPFRVYSLRAKVKPYGTALGAQDVPLLRAG